MDVDCVIDGLCRAFGACYLLAMFIVDGVRFFFVKWYFYRIGNGLGKVSEYSDRFDYSECVVWICVIILKKNDFEIVFLLDEFIE